MSDEHDVSRTRFIVRWYHLIIIALSLVGLLWTGGRVLGGFYQGTTRLSQAGTVCDIEPRAAASEDGAWLTSIWIRGRQVGGGCTSRGDAIVRWAAEDSTTYGWSPEVQLPLPSGACAVHADVAVVDTTAHVAVSYWQPCDAADASSGIQYYTCDLTGSSCTVHSTPVQQSGSVDQRLSDVRIVVDGSSQPHIVYARGTHGLSNGRILYVRREGTTWAAPVLVSTYTGSAYDGFYRPTVAASQGRVHIAWERHRDWIDSQGRRRQRGDVQYRYCEAATGNCQPSIPKTFLYPTEELEDTSYPLPVLAARDGRIVVVWNVCADISTDPPCQSFHLLYARSNTNGSYPYLNEPIEVQTERAIRNLDLSLQRYPGTDDALGGGLASAYAAYPRTTVALDRDQLPYIAWQIPEGSGYVITTTHATAATTTSFSWAQTSRYQLGTGSDVRIAASLFLPDPDVDPEGIHLIHLKAWAEEVSWHLASRSQVYYDYLGPRQVYLEPVADSELHQLPLERGVSVRVRVTDQEGGPVSGIPVMFKTDRGSFAYLGYGTQIGSGKSNSEGWAEATLYSNLPGSAHVRAWIDTTSDGVWGEDEVNTSLTRTWAPSTATPALNTGAFWAMSGDVITATLRNHPYEIDSYPDHAAPYVLWLCPAGAAPTTEGIPVVSGLTSEVATWNRENVPVQIPVAVPAGRYVLESHLDSSIVDRPVVALGSVAADPCGDSKRVAVSGEIEVRAAPPAGTPWIVISESHPSPSQRINAKLLAHSVGTTYSLWWCPAAPDAAPVQATVGTVTVSTLAPEPSTTIQVPAGVSGLYRVHSYTGVGGCGTTGLVGRSALMDVHARVYLPLAMRGY